MKEEMLTFGYLCPACGKSVSASRSVFALEASNAEAECSCGGSALRVEFDGRIYHILVPCGVCGETHEAVCTPEQLFRKGGIGLSCSKTGQLCCYIGQEETVEKRLRELELLAEKEKRGDPQTFADNVIMYEVLSELRDIAARPGGLTCACGSARCGMEIRHSAVDLVCRDCGARLRIPAATDEDLDALCCRMKLVIPGKQP